MKMVLFWVGAGSRAARFKDEYLICEAANCDDQYSENEWVLCILMCRKESFGSK
jgi:hypothetical protein